MLRLKGDNTLTVYNGVEEQAPYKSADGTPPVHDVLCCGLNKKSEQDDHCAFRDSCTEELKTTHRKLLLGEPLKGSHVPGIPLEIVKLFDEDGYDSKGLEYILEAASTALIKVKEAQHGNEAVHLVPKAEREPQDIYIAVAILKLFIQLNYTGPEIVDEGKDTLLKFDQSCEGKDMKLFWKNILDVDALSIQETVKSPALLVASKYFLSSIQCDPVLWPFYLIWRFRIDYIHQHSLSRRSWTISRNLKSYADNYIQWLSRGHVMDNALVDVNASFMCEIAEMLSFYYDGILSGRFLEEACSVLGLSVAVSGRMGFRTKFQQTPAPQSVVNISLLSPFSENDVVFQSLIGNVPSSEPLNDDTRLERVRLVDEELAPSLLGIHQIPVLGMMRRIGDVDGSDLTRQEKEALINSVIDQPITWSARVTALMERSRMEKLDRRAIDRAVRQLQELWKKVSRYDSLTHASYRQHLFFGSGHPSKTEIRLLLGEIFLHCELWNEALDIYSEMGIFENTVTCYVRMGLNHRAEELVRQQIKEEGDSPKLLVLLGDVTREISHYEAAWKLSAETNADSQIKLGNYHFQRKEYEKAAIYLKRAVKQVPLEYPTWIRLAWCHYQNEDYEQGYQAYLYAANLEYDNFQVWNNLANCALKMDKKEYALRAYKESAKCSYDEWRVWSNILSVSTDLGILSDAVHAYHRIIDLNKQFKDGAMELDKVVDIVATNEEPKFSDVSTLDQLFRRITSEGTKSPHMWHLHGRVLIAYLSCRNTEFNGEVKLQHLKKALQCYDKALMLMRQDSTWKTDLSQLRNVVTCLMEFRTQRHFGESVLGKEAGENLKSLDLMLRQAAQSIYKTVDNLMQEIDNSKLREIFDDLSKELNNEFYLTS